MASKRERELLRLLGSASRGVSIVSQSIAAILLLLEKNLANQVPQDDVRSLGHNLVSLAGALTDLGVEIARGSSEPKEPN
jgi:hypothetical protein